MRIRVLSDLHLEFGPAILPDAEADVVVLAGDVATRRHGLHWAGRRFPRTPVVYVAGNHEYYGGVVPRLAVKLREFAAGSLVHVLENGRLELHGVTFLACTLWTDMRLFGDPRSAALEAEGRMTDYKRIRVEPRYRKLRATDSIGMHLASRRWLENELQKPAAGPTVVVTHHAPSPRSLPPPVASELLAAAYASDLEELVAASGAALWVHGHIHRRSDYRIGSTRVVCNPRGYPGEVTEFDPAMVVEV
ncbi:MAG TPA: metallophosphoesterase [Acidobacteriota bacterium]|jgi:predicted phosphodiesterase